MAWELSLAFDVIQQEKGEKFIFLIDGWDSVFRYWKGEKNELEEYITMNFDGLRDDIILLLTDEKCPLNVLGFSNALESFQDKEEVLAALVHLGYLTYKDGQVSIPNRELREEFSTTVKRVNWGTALKCVIHLAYYAAQDLYELLFETPAGKGYADCVMKPKKKGMPGIVIELKYNQSLEQGILQIKDKKYASIFGQDLEEVILVAVNYDKKSKKHQCAIKKERP